MCCNRCICVYVCVSLFIHPSTHPSSVHLSVSVCMFVYLLIFFSMYLSYYMARVKVPTALTMKIPVVWFVSLFGLGGVTDVSENPAAFLIEGSVSRRQQSLACVFLLPPVSSFLCFFFLFWLVFVRWTSKPLLMTHPNFQCCMV